MRTSPRLLFLGLCLSVASLLSGCQLPDTKTKDSRTIPREWYSKGQLKPLEINDKTVLLDSRARFEYGLSHVPGSVRVGWEEFTEGGSQRSGLLMRDLSKAAAKLALLGITPETPVVIIGKGREGDGDAGRLAWTLHYLGVKNVQMVHIAYFKSQLTQNETEPRANAADWKAEPQEKELIDLEEIKKIMLTRAPHEEQKIQLIDVRTPEEYFAKSKDGSTYLTPEMPAMNMPWTEFIDPMGRPDPVVAEKLKAMGLGLNDRVLLISQKGVRSAAALMALHELGYKNVAHYNGGYDQLLKVPATKKGLNESNPRVKKKKK